MQEKEYQHLLSSVIKVARNALSANRAKSKLLSSLSYELRSALTGIIGTAQLLILDCLLPSQKQSVADILNISESILPLIDRLFNVSEREAQQIDLNVRAFNLKTLLEKMATQLMFQAKAKGIQFLLDYPSHVPVNVIGDPDIIYQLLIHLSFRALNDTDQGSIVVQLNFVQDEEEHECGEFIISIEDSGKGMQEIDLKELRTYLEQTNLCFFQDYRSIDLGIGIALTYIKLLNAKLEVESTFEKGSLFTCRMTLKRAINELVKKTCELSKPILPRVSPVKLRILLVEDNETIQRIYRSIFKKIQGCSVDSAVSAKTALEYYMQHTYDLIIMDIGLPDNNGIEITQVIRRQENQAERVPIVAVTAHGNDKDKENFLKAGINDVFIKPINLEEIIIMLEKWTRFKNVA